MTSRAGIAGTAPRQSEIALFHAIRAVNVLYARVYHQLEVCAPSQLPRTGPAIVACNHTSGLDPALIQSACSRNIVWMMAAEYYEQPALRWFFKLVRAIPVDRGGRDMSATRQAMRALNEGFVLGIFPEGRIETSRNLLPFQTGVAMLALKMRIGVYPAWLDGTQRGREMLQVCLQSQSARIAFGPRVDLGSGMGKSDLLLATKVLENAIGDLRQRLCVAGLE